MSIKSDRWIRHMVKEMGLIDLFTSPIEGIKPNPDAYILGLRREFINPLKPHIAGHVAAVLVAMMRSTGLTPSVGLVSKLILDYAPLGFDLWQIK